MYLFQCAKKSKNTTVQHIVTTGLRAHTTQKLPRQPEWVDTTVSLMPRSVYVLLLSLVIVWRKWWTSEQHWHGATERINKYRIQTDAVDAYVQTVLTCYMQLCYTLYLQSPQVFVFHTDAIYKIYINSMRWKHIRTLTSFKPRDFNQVVFCRTD